MIRSMTGFGRYEVSDENRKLAAEVKAVNHRYLDVSVRLPRKLNMFEPAIRNLLKQRLQRGKVDVFISYEDHQPGQLSLRYNRELAGEYIEHFAAMSADFGLENNIQVSELSRYPEVLTMEEQSKDESALWSSLKEVVNGAVSRLIEQREKEGQALREDLLLKLGGMEKLVAFIEEKSPLLVEEYQKKLKTRVDELLLDAKYDESRILTEVALFADKMCVDEEIVRLKSHVEQTKQALAGEESIGRKLDFIAQELNREANTILSKSSDMEVSNAAVDLKTEIEKVREQIQNIE